MEETKNSTIEKLLENKIGKLGEELRKILSESICVGYDFYDKKIEKISNDIFVICKSGLKLRSGAGEIVIGADIKYSSIIPVGRGKRFITFDIDYRLYKGRDLGFVVSDQINFLEGESWDESLYNVPATRIMFAEILRMVQPLTTKSPMPVF